MFVDSHNVPFAHYVTGAKYVTVIGMRLNYEDMDAFVGWVTGQQRKIDKVVDGEAASK